MFSDRWLFGVFWANGGDGSSSSDGTSGQGGDPGAAGAAVGTSATGGEPGGVMGSVSGEPAATAPASTTGLSGFHVAGVNAPGPTGAAPARGGATSQGQGGGGGQGGTASQGQGGGGQGFGGEAGGATGGGPSPGGGGQNFGATSLNALAQLAQLFGVSPAYGKSYGLGGGSLGMPFGTPVDVSAPNMSTLTDKDFAPLGSLFGQPSGADPAVVNRLIQAGLIGVPRGLGQAPSAPSPSLAALADALFGGTLGALGTNMSLGGQSQFGGTTAPTAVAESPPFGISDAGVPNLGTMPSPSVFSPPSPNLGGMPSPAAFSGPSRGGVGDPGAAGTAVGTPAAPTPEGPTSATPAATPPATTRGETPAPTVTPEAQAALAKMSPAQIAQVATLLSQNPNMPVATAVAIAQRASYGEGEVIPSQGFTPDAQNATTGPTMRQSPGTVSPYPSQRAAPSGGPFNPGQSASLQGISQMLQDLLGLSTGNPTALADLAQTNSMIG